MAPQKRIKGQKLPHIGVKVMLSGLMYTYPFSPISGSRGVDQGECSCPWGGPDGLCAPSRGIGVVRIHIAVDVELKIGENRHLRVLKYAQEVCTS